LDHIIPLVATRATPPLDRQDAGSRGHYHRGWAVGSRLPWGFLGVGGWNRHFKGTRLGFLWFSFTNPSFDTAGDEIHVEIPGTSRPGYIQQLRGVREGKAWGVIPSP